MIAAAGGAKNGASSGQYDYDLIIIGAGVGGHGAAIHAVDMVRICSVYLQTLFYFINFTANQESHRHSKYKKSL